MHSIMQPCDRTDGNLKNVTAPSICFKIKNQSVKTKALDEIRRINSLKVTRKVYQKDIHFLKSPTQKFTLQGGA